MNPMANTGGDERVMTPPELAQRIVRNFMPSGYLLEPCRGQGAFYNAMQPYGTVDWFEIDEGRDFLSDRCSHHYDWIITNPPWGRKFRDFLKKSMEIADNVVFLANLNVWQTKSRITLLREHNFGTVEQFLVDTPDKPWPQQGFQLAATWIRRNWNGPTYTHHLLP